MNLYYLNIGPCWGPDLWIYFESVLYQLNHGGFGIMGLIYSEGHHESVITESMTPQVDAGPSGGGPIWEPSEEHHVRLSPLATAVIITGVVSGCL